MFLEVDKNKTIKSVAFGNPNMVVLENSASMIHINKNLKNNEVDFDNFKFEQPYSITEETAEYPFELTEI
jgi:hypothetical protein